MNTTDAIQAIKAGDFHALVEALDADQRAEVPVPGTEYVFTVVRIGQTVIVVSPGPESSPYVSVATCGHESCAIRLFENAVRTGNETLDELATAGILVISPGAMAHAII